MRKQRLLMQESNPHYLKPSKSASQNIAAQNETILSSGDQNETLIPEANGESM